MSETSNSPTSDHQRRFKMQSNCAENLDYFVPEDNGTSQDKLTIMSEKSANQKIFAANLPVV